MVLLDSLLFRLERLRDVILDFLPNFTLLVVSQDGCARNLTRLELCFFLGETHSMPAQREALLGESIRRSLYLEVIKCVIHLPKV